MTSITRRRLLVVAATVVLVALLVVTMQAVFAEDNTFVTTAGETDGDWPWKSAFGTVAVGNPADSYHAAVNHWNPASNGSISMDVKDGTGETMSFNMTAWSASANVVNGSGASWTWDTDNPSHAPAAYPDFFQGCHWGQCTWDSGDYGSGNAGIPYPIRASTITNLTSTFDIGVTGPADGSGAVWNAAFDIWLDKGERVIQDGWYHTTTWGSPNIQTEVYGDYVGWPILPGFPGAYLKYKNEDGTANPDFAQIGQNDGVEVMIWMNNRGYNNNPIRPAGTQVMDGANPLRVTLAGGTWEVWAARLGKSGENPKYMDWNVVSYVRVNTDGTNPNVQEMTNFDANVFIQDATTRDCPTAVNGAVVPGNKCAYPGWWLTSVQAGFEIWANGQGLSLDTFSVKPNVDTSKPAVQVDTGRTTDGTPDGMPLIHWAQKFLLRYETTCEAGVSVSIDDNDPATTLATYNLTKVVDNADGDADLWAVRAGPIFPIHNNPDLPGDSTITFTTGCGTSTQVPVYIDPSGVVVNTLGEPIEGAKVTLQYAPGVASTEPEPAAGDFEMVPNGSDIMSPANRDNPDYTDAIGYYRWDVADGWYKVKAEKEGCTSAESIALSVSEGNPATNVNLVLDCGDVPPDDVSVVMTPMSDWNTGYCRNVIVTNHSSAPVDWKVTFTLVDGGKIDNFWNVIWSQNGNQVTAEGVDWNNILQPGQSSHSLGFCAAK